MRERSIWFRMFIGTVIFVVAIFFLMTLSFQFFIKGFFYDLTNRSIQEEMAIIIGDGQVIELLMEDAPEEVFFSTHVFLIEDKNRLVGEWYTKQERKVIHKILGHVKEGHIFQKEKAAFIEIEKETFLIEKRKVKGVFNGDVIETRGQKADKDYEIYVYVNITSMQLILSGMKKWMSALFILFGVILIGVITVEQRKTGKSFERLNHYLQEIGEKKKFSNRLFLLGT